MKRIITIILLGFLGFFSSVSFANNAKIDPAFSLFSPSANSSRVSLGKAMSSKVGNVRMVESFVSSLDPKATAKKLLAKGAKVRIIAGDIMTVLLPQNLLVEISAWPEVNYIEAAKPIQVSNNLQPAKNNYNKAQASTKLPVNFTGKNVIIGIIDTGIDLSHPDFQDESGNSRVLSTWDQHAVSFGRAPRELANSYGIECVREEILADECFMHDFDGHGTHVAGTAASSDEKYGGVAPDANIIVVRYLSELEVEDAYANALFSTTICDAAYYIFEKAKKLGMPAVVNLSLGTHIGAHDGSSLFEQCLDALLEGYAGRAIVAAAGNERIVDPVYTGINTSIETAGEAKASNFVIRDNTSHQFFYLDIWGEVNDDFEVGLVMHHGSPDSSVSYEKSDMLQLGEALSGTFYGGDIHYQINAHEKLNPSNNKTHIGITLEVPAKINPAGFSFDLLVQGTGKIDAWFYPDKPAQTINFTKLAGDLSHEWSYVAGSVKSNVSIPSTAKNIISVGGYMATNNWSSSYDVGELLPFSSIGPALNPHYTGIKPELVAPGGVIASSKSRASTLDDEGFDHSFAVGENHTLMAGTSMAAPFVSGTVALMFSANSTLTYDNVERFLIENTYLDNTVGEVPNDSWGYGKLDVIKSVEAAVAEFGVLGGGSALLNEGDGSSGGCSIGLNKAPLANVLILFISFAGLFVRRKFYRQA